MSETELLTEGWHFPPGSRKCHYFVVEPRLEADRGGFSLCSKYGYMFARHVLQAPTSSDKGPDDCAECARRLARRMPADA